MSDCKLESILYPSTQNIHGVSELLEAFGHLQNHTDCLLPAQIPKNIARSATKRTERIDENGFCMQELVKDVGFLSSIGKR